MMVLNLIWDGITLVALYFMLNNKRLAFIGLVEFIVPLYPVAQLRLNRAPGAYMPTATIIVLIDLILERKWVEK